MKIVALITKSDVDVLRDLRDTLSSSLGCADDDTETKIHIKTLDKIVKEADNNQS